MNTVAVDHFAGVGWGVAAHRLDIREYGVDNAGSLIRIRSANSMRTIYRDVWSGLFHPWLVPNHRLYIASPPCQTFSMAGHGEGRAALDDVLTAIDEERWKDAASLHGLTEHMDPRTALVLTPLAHIWAHRPELVALEQVPEVLPVWHAIARVLRTFGYSVWAGILRAEQYGVPQTRKRAILMARLDGKVSPPAPTHSRYYSTEPTILDPGVKKWVSMAEALGFDGAGRVLRSNYSDGSTGELGERDGDEPSPTLTSKADRMKWVARKAMGSGMVKRHGERPGRSLDQPAFTIRGNAGGMEPGSFVFREELRDWEWLDAPATTVAGDPRITAREHHEHGEQSGTSLRLTYLEAAALQSFPNDMAWPGNQGERFLAIGNAVPPLLAQAVLSALLAPAGERDAWDHVFAEVAG
ncbi:DNA cytosine methyltransferase [Microbacterium sp. CBA3102]|uniref:DNA cytosine methyltransferase n=1 Tax=Microbacterium sp. CBA3102 TaxID=2603598 RepID=UPI0011BBE59B|nr:DNA cytosine methyltransferase [Microbacterium sp. CBA3102]QEA30410.1 DNA cytosine methyltransferase [Microbacterium sp. CBA3102]